MTERNEVPGRFQGAMTLLLVGSSSHRKESIDHLMYSQGKD